MNILIPLASGVEEMEAVIVMDVLRRARWDVTAAAVGGALTLTASRGVKLTADCCWDDLGEDVEAFDAMVIPGGLGGTRILCGTDAVLHTIRSFHQAGKRIGAICAGPLVLQAAGVLAGRRYTCYPGLEADILNATHETGNTVRDGNLITSRGPGTAFEFALELIMVEDGMDAAATVRRQLLLT